MSELSNSNVGVTGYFIPPIGTPEREEWDKQEAKREAEYQQYMKEQKEKDMEEILKAYKRGGMEAVYEWHQENSNDDY